MKKGFTLIELLVVISIISLLSTIVLASVNSARNKAYVARAKSEFRTMHTAMELYASDHNGDYPADVARDTLPVGMGQYFSTAWPKGPWPGSFYDWDSWQNVDFNGQKISQISIRFCPQGGGISSCKFPKEPWAMNFDEDSAVYFCISGSCRSHEGQPLTHPGYCINCQ